SRAAAGRRGGSCRAAARRPPGPWRRRRARASRGGAGPPPRRSRAGDVFRFRTRRLLPVAGGAGGGRGDAELARDLPADAKLLEGRRVPVHVGDAVEGTKVALGLPVAVETPVHRQRGHRIDHGHLRHVAMAAGAADATIDVRLVAEEDEVGDAVDPFPGDGDVFEKTFTDRLEDGRLDPDLAVTSHAEVGRRQSRLVASIGEVVAKETVDSVVEDVVSVIELDRLLDRLR